MISLNECITDYSTVYLINNRDQEKKSLFRRKKTPDKKIFIKSFNYNEFIGETLCLKRDIDTTHYFLVGMIPERGSRYSTYGEIKDKYYPINIGSYDFKKADRDYLSLEELGLENRNKLNDILDRTNSSKNKEELKRELLELLALDTYMGQKDRFSTNILFEQDQQGNLSLSPLYDFSFSLKSDYSLSNDIYDNAINPLCRIEDYYEFIKKYPEFRDILKEYMDMDLLSVIYDTNSRANFRVEQKLLKPYKETHDSRMKVLKKIVR